MANLIDGDLVVTGGLAVGGSFAIPAGSVGNAAVQAGANIDPSKLGQDRSITMELTAHAVDAVAIRKVLHRVKGATGTLISFKVGATVAATSTGEAVIDLKKNGTTILTGTLTLTASQAAFTGILSGTFSSAGVVVGDVLEASIESVTGSTLPKGVFVTLHFTETQY